jgi:hypothetical protein
VNLERLPDAPLSAQAVTPEGALAALAAIYRSHDSVQQAEAKAHLFAIEGALKSEFSANATPPPPDQRDPRPLVQAILGTWRTGPMSMSFMPDGTMVATLPGNSQRRGRWSIGPDGRLHADADGGDLVADAWVAGNVLTIASDGRAVSYNRTPD